MNQKLAPLMNNTTRTTSTSDYILFICLFVFAYIYILSLSEEFIPYLFPKTLFIIELLIILVYSIQHPLPFVNAFKNTIIRIITTLWITLSLAKIFFTYYKNLPTDYWLDDFVLYIFHAVFFIYIFAILQRIQVKETSITRLCMPYNFKPDKFLYYLLYLITFSIALTSIGEYAYINAEIAITGELLFIITYILLYKQSSSLASLFFAHKKTAYLFFFLILTISSSYLASPYVVFSEKLGAERFFATIIHISFFIFVFKFLKNELKTGCKITTAIPLSITALAIFYIITWHNIDPTSITDWFQDPPLNSHIRQISFITSVSTSACLALCLHTEKNNKLLMLTLLLVSASFLIWTGGRAATASVLLSLLFITAYLLYIKKLNYIYFVTVIVALLLAIVIAESFKVFHWNGLYDQVARSVEATSMKTFSTNRTTLWSTTIESLNGNWLLGLGPNGYWFMPNHVYGLQPHNLFIQLLAEWGIIGTVIFCYLLYIAAVSILKRACNKNEVISSEFLSATAIIISLTAQSLFDGAYYHGQPSYYLALSFAICLSQISNKPRKLN